MSLPSVSCTRGSPFQTEDADLKFQSQLASVHCQSCRRITRSPRRTSPAKPNSPLTKSQLTKVQIIRHGPIRGSVVLEYGYRLARIEHL